jgi:hypothetical protein
MFGGFRLIFLGLFFATFHITMGPLQILPAFVGWINVVYGLSKLRSEFEHETFQKATLYATFLIIHSIISFVIGFIYGSSVDNSIPIILWNVVFGLFELLLDFKILEGAITFFNLTSRHELAEEFTHHLKIYICIFIPNIILIGIGATLMNQVLISISVILALVLRVIFMAMVNRLKKESSNMTSRIDIKI